MKTNEQRRRIAGLIGWASLAGGSRLAAPASWFRPVVESVVLPAHAQTSPAEPRTPGPYTYSTPGQYQLVLPRNAVEVTIDAYGAAGGDQRSGAQIFGGPGGHAWATFAVAGGSVLDILVGGRGGDGGIVSGNVGTGGLGGGADGGDSASATPETGGGGGGRSEVSIGATLLIVAGGGGGAGGASGGHGGGGGGLNGDSGGNNPTTSVGHGGTGGTQAAGGSGGASGGDLVGPDGQDGMAGQGGVGADGGAAGGGGGGGYYGGGGGGAETNTSDSGQDGGGGGGGSGHIDGSGTNTLFANGVQSGNGLVIVSLVVS